MTQQARDAVLAGNHAVVGADGCVVRVVSASGPMGGVRLDSIRMPSSVWTWGSSFSAIASAALVRSRDRHVRGAVAPVTAQPRQAEAHHGLGGLGRQLGQVVSAHDVRHAHQTDAVDRAGPGGCGFDHLHAGRRIGAPSRGQRPCGVRARVRLAGPAHALVAARRDQRWPQDGERCRIGVEQLFGGRGRIGADLVIIGMQPVD